MGQKLNFSCRKHGQLPDTEESEDEIDYLDLEAGTSREDESAISDMAKEANSERMEAVFFK